MKYVNNRVRRQDRLMDEQRALELLRDGEYGVLSMVADDAGYGIPVNFVWDGDHNRHRQPPYSALHTLHHVTILTPAAHPLDGPDGIPGHLHTSY